MPFAVLCNLLFDRPQCRQADAFFCPCKLSQNSMFCSNSSLSRYSAANRFSSSMTSRSNLSTEIKEPIQASFATWRLEHCKIVFARDFWRNALYNRSWHNGLFLQTGRLCQRQRVSPFCSINACTLSHKLPINNRLMRSLDDIPLAFRDAACSASSYRKRCRICLAPCCRYRFHLSAYRK